jgi:hypothetical protein
MLMVLLSYTTELFQNALLSLIMHFFNSVNDEFEGSQVFQSYI